MMAPVAMCEGTFWARDLDSSSWGQAPQWMGEVLGVQIWGSGSPRLLR